MGGLKVEVGPILAPWQDRIDTKVIALEEGLLPRSAEVLRGVLPEGRWLLVVDAVTWGVAGEAVGQSLSAAGLPWDRYTVEPAPGEEVPVADDAKIEALRAFLAASGHSAVVAVGAGTINDVAKMATFQAKRPYAIVATAPSMNGYTSTIAAILSQGVKITAPCHAPVACLGDLGVLAEAPYRMIASGYGDLLSKPVSNADWRLAARLMGASYSPETIRLVEQGFAFLEGVAPLLPTRDREAVGKLTATLCISGLAMAVAGSSSPASGGEHLVSHYIDMTHFAYGEPHDFHGCQVAVGTVTTAALYEKLAAMRPEDIDVEALVAACEPIEQYEAKVRAHFGVLADSVVEHTRKIHPTQAQLRARLELLKAEWSDLLADVGASLRPAQAIRDDLTAAQCPSRFDEIGVTPARARASVVHSKDIRARYTILHLAADLGRLEAWTDEILRDLHGIRA